MRERENPSRKVRVSDEIHYVQRGLVFDFVLGCCCDHRHWFGRWGGRENCGKRGKDMKLGNPFVCRLNKEMGTFGGWSERERERRGGRIWRRGQCRWQPTYARIGI